MSRTLVVSLAGALLATALVTAARAQDDRCTGGQTPGGVIIVQFDRGQALVTQRAQRELAAIARKAIAQKANLLCLDAFADAFLGQERDHQLARARAEAVANELAANGYPREKIIIHRITDPKRVLGQKETSAERKVEIRYGR
ncbi:MAG: OmpA family protein [Alphaproteobacteria bacterium]|nr:OmpA family protein [Alphaproteobacteria bacterium]